MQEDRQLWESQNVSNAVLNLPKELKWSMRVASAWQESVSWSKPDDSGNKCSSTKGLFQYSGAIKIRKLAKLAPEVVIFLL